MLHFLDVKTDQLDHVAWDSKIKHFISTTCKFCRCESSIWKKTNYTVRGKNQKLLLNIENMYKTDKRYKFNLLNLFLFHLSSVY